ncbi:hypothetical protein BJX76DRAFT_331127 [Aspergillus varians]
MDRSVVAVRINLETAVADQRSRTIFLSLLVYLWLASSISGVAEAQLKATIGVPVPTFPYKMWALVLGRSIDPTGDGHRS